MKKSHHQTVNNQHLTSIRHRIKTNKGLSVLALATLMSQQMAYAKDSEESTLELEPVEVIAEKNASFGDNLDPAVDLGFLGTASAKEAPFSVTSYTDNYIRNIQARDITDVINKVDPSVMSNNDHGSWSENYSIRGFNITPNDMTVNGLLGITPYYRTTPKIYERVQVLRGASAILTGMLPNGSVGGAINLIPKRAAEVPLTRITTDYTASGQVGGHLDIGRRFGSNKQFGVRANGIYRNGEGAIEDQKNNKKVGSLGLDWQTERTSLSLDVYASKERIDGVSRGILMIGGAPSTVPKPPEASQLITPPWGYVINEDTGIMLDGSFDINANNTVYAKYGTSWSDYKYNGSGYGTFPDEDGNFTTNIGQLKFDIKKSSAELGAKGVFSTGPVVHNWVANTTYYHRDQNEFGMPSIAGASVITNLYNPVWNKPAVPMNPNLPQFIKRELTLNSYGIADTLGFLEGALKLTLGVRHQTITDESLLGTPSKQEKSATVPSVAVAYKLSDDVLVYANYMEGLSQGAIAPVGASNVGEVFEPKVTTQKEIGIKFDVLAFSSTVSVFDIKKPGFFHNRAAGVFTTTEQRNQGIEWSLFGNITERIRTMSGIAYSKPQLTKTGSGKNQGKMPIGQPNVQAKIGAEWDTPLIEGITLSANASYLSKQYVNNDNTVSLPSRTIYDVGARYYTEFADTPVTVSALVNNVTNESYWGVGQFDAFLTLGAPRTFTLSASVDL